MKDDRGKDIPSWLRLTWITFTPDEEDLLRTPFNLSSYRKEIKRHRPPPTPDRYIYHLFMAGKSIPEMKRILHLKSKSNLANRITTLQENGWITADMRKRWRSEVYFKGNVVISKPRNLLLYRRISSLLEKRAYTISELQALTSAPRGTITRYVALWKKRRPGILERREEPGG